MAFGGARAKSSATSVGEKAAVAAAVAWTQRRRDPAASTPQTSAALTRAPASPSETGKAAPPPVPLLRASVLPFHHHLRSSPPPVPLLRSVKSSGEGRSKDAVEAGPLGTPFSTTARALRRVSACATAPSRPLASFRQLRVSPAKQHCRQGSATRKSCRGQGTGPAARRRGIAGRAVGHDRASSGAVTGRTWTTSKEPGKGKRSRFAA